MRDEKKIHKQEEIRLILVAVRVAVPPFRNPLTVEVTDYFRHFSTQNNDSQRELYGSPGICFVFHQTTELSALATCLKASKPSPEHVCAFLHSVQRRITLSCVAFMACLNPE